MLHPPTTFKTTLCHNSIQSHRQGLCLVRKDKLITDARFQVCLFPKFFLAAFLLRFLNKIGHLSGRSSTSSLNNVHAASTASTRSSLGVEPGVGSLASPRGAKLSVQFNRKVSINEHPVVVVSQPPQPPPTPKLTPTPRGSENGDPAAINGESF